MRFLLFAAAIAIVTFSGCTKLQQPAPDLGESVELPEQELYNATITFYKDDKLSTILKAGQIRKYQQKQTVMMDSGIVVDFFDEFGRHATTLWADSGNANERTQNLFASGHVVAISDSGERLETSVLRWDPVTRRIISDAAVKISTPTDTIYGSGFVSDQNLKNWTIERPEGITFRDLSKESFGTSSLVDTIITTDEDTNASDTGQ
jgi:LPS export ABC transporter protein LptC